MTGIDMTNPKDLLGAKKIDLGLFPDVAVLYGAHAMFDGAGKYGPYNWREKHVRATVYITAARRHLLAWASGEEYAQDSGVHHLGHVLGCVAILLDAQVTGALVDDRRTSAAVIKLLADLNYAIAAKGMTPTAVLDLAETITETASEIETVEQLVDIAFRDVPAREDYLLTALGAQQAETRKQAFEQPVAWDYQGNPTEGPWQDDPETDTEATEAVEWKDFPLHPLASKGNRSGANGMKAGDVCYDHINKRQCRVDEFLQDGDAYVAGRAHGGKGKATYWTTKWNALELIGQMEWIVTEGKDEVVDVQTHGEDREKESSK